MNCFFLGGGLNTGIIITAKDNVAPSLFKMMVTFQFEAPLRYFQEFRSKLKQFLTATAIHPQNYAGSFKQIIYHETANHIQIQVQMQMQMQIQMIQI